MEAWIRAITSAPKRLCGLGQPCRHPEDALPSLEAYGVNVSKLAAACGMKYVNGANTVTYFAGVLFDPPTI